MAGRGSMRSFGALIREPSVPLRRSLLLIALTATGLLSGCGEEKVDPRVEKAVLKQNQGQAERDQQMRSGRPSSNP